MTLEEAGCQYADTDPHAAWLVRQYRHFVEDGHTPLHQCPEWMIEVGERVRSYRAKRDAQRRRDRKIEEKKQNVRAQLDAQT